MCAVYPARFVDRRESYRLDVNARLIRVDAGDLLGMRNAWFTLTQVGRFATVQRTIPPIDLSLRRHSIHLQLIRAHPEPANAVTTATVQTTTSLNATPNSPLVTPNSSQSSLQQLKQTPISSPSSPPPVIRERDAPPEVRWQLPCLTILWVCMFTFLWDKVKIP